MREERLFVLFLEFLERMKVHTSEIRQRLEGNSYLYPLRCHPNCFPQGREIILAADRSMIGRYMVLVAVLTKTFASLIIKVAYRICMKKVRDCVYGKGEETRVKRRGYYWLLIDHPAVIGGDHKKVDAASGYFPFIETIEHAGLIQIERIYNISELRRFRMRSEARITSILGLREVMELLKVEMESAFKLLKLAWKEGMSSSDRMGLYGAAIAQISFKTLEAKMIGVKVRERLKRDKWIRGVITTFEGHAYERQVSMACAEEGVAHVAFQHSPFLDTQYAVKEVDKFSAPSVVLFSSKKAYSEFRKSEISRRRKEKPVLVLVGGSSGKQDWMFSARKADYFSPADMMGLPNGDDRELVVILREAERLMCRGMLRRLVLRFHPIAKERHYTMARAAIRKSRVLRNRVIMRKDNAIEDEHVHECFYSLYISSSACLKYLCQGIVPVIVGNNNIHLSPLTSKVRIMDLEDDLSEDAYKVRLLAGRKEYGEIYSEHIPGRMVRRVSQILEHGARVTR